MPSSRIATFATAVAAALLSCSAALAAPCDAAVHRAFDFWLGKWEVRTPNGKLAGNSRIEREYGGCVIHEFYETPSGYRGESLNIYDAGRKHWNQNWVDNTGVTLRLDGGLQTDGKMVLEGTSIGPDGKPTQQRISWTPNPDGTVRQLWETADGKGGWAVAFDGQYTRVAP